MNCLQASFDFVSAPFANTTTGTTDQSIKGQMWNKIGRVVGLFPPIHLSQSILGFEV
jgi:hypothetical protein